MKESPGSRIGIALLRGYSHPLHVCIFLFYTNNSDQTMIYVGFLQSLKNGEHIPYVFMPNVHYLFS